MVMENYEEFYRRCVYKVNAASSCNAEPSHRGAPSVIHFHGRPVLQPKLTEEQRIEMARQRQKAVERECEKCTLRTSSLLDRVQDILNHGQLQKVQDVVDTQVKKGAEPSPLDPQSPSLRRTDAEDQLPVSSRALRRKTLRILNNRMEELGKREEVWVQEEVEGEKTSSSGTQSSQLGDIQTGSEDKAGGADLESEPEGQIENRNDLCIRETDKRNERWALECPIVVKSGNHFTSVESSCSIVIESSATSPASLSLSASLMGSYVQLPSPQPSCSPLNCLRKPRLSTAPNILISLPVSELELNKTNTAHCESHLPENSSNATTKSSSESLTVPSTGGAWNCDCFELSSKKLSSNCTSTPSSSASITPSRPVTLSPKPSPTQQGPFLHREKNRQSHSTHFQRSPPAPLNQSYDVESPMPFLLRPHISSDSELFTVPVRRRLNLRQCPEQPTEDRKPLGHLYENLKLQGKAGGYVHQQNQVLEVLCQHLEEDHAHQLSQLLKTQQGETQRLQQEIQRKQVDSSVLAGEPKSVLQLHTQMKAFSVEQQMAVCYLTAVGQGFLTRRLLQTEKIKHLRKTIRDSRELIRAFQTDAQQRRASFTPQDLSLQRRVRAQLRAALCNVHEIFFEWPVRKRLALLKQDRELRNERRMKETVKARKSQDRPGLSSATQKSVDRKKQRQGKKIPPEPKTSSARKVVRRTVENHRSHLSQV